MRIAAALALAALALASSAAAGSARRPALALAGQPLSVRGEGFRAHERVLVLMTSSTFAKRAVLTDAAGRFRLELPSVSTGVCRSLLIQALGAAGERASVGIGTAGCGSGKLPGVSIPTP